MSPLDPPSEKGNSTEVEAAAFITEEGGGPDLYQKHLCDTKGSKIWKVVQDNGRGKVMEEKADDVTC